MSLITSTWIRCDVCGNDEGHAERTPGRTRIAAVSMTEFLERGGIRHHLGGDQGNVDECLDCKTRRLALGDPDHAHTFESQPSGRGPGWDDECACGAIANPRPVA